jgi:hypothetical protein
MDREEFIEERKREIVRNKLKNGVYGKFYENDITRGENFSKFHPSVEILLNTDRSAEIQAKIEADFHPFLENNDELDENDDLTDFSERTISRPKKLMSNGVEKMNECEDCKYIGKEVDIIFGKNDEFYLCPKCIKKRNNKILQ